MIDSSQVSVIRKSLGTVKVIAGLVLAEQFAEMVILGVSLAENPVIVIVSLGALGFPVPKEQDKEPEKES